MQHHINQSQRCLSQNSLHKFEVLEIFPLELFNSFEFCLIILWCFCFFFLLCWAFAKIFLDFPNISYSWLLPQIYCLVSLSKACLYLCTLNPVIQPISLPDIPIFTLNWIIPSTWIKICLFCTYQKNCWTHFICQMLHKRFYSLCNKIPWKISIFPSPSPLLHILIWLSPHHSTQNVLVMVIK